MLARRKVVIGAAEAGLSGEMDLTGQLSNLSSALEKLLVLPLPRFSDRGRPDNPRQSAIFRRRGYEVIRDAIVHELATEESGLRLMEIRRRVEARLGEPVASARFRDYVNYQSKSANPWLERLGYGMYRLRS
jgi:hypothetical protein